MRLFFKEAGMFIISIIAIMNIQLIGALKT